MLCGNGDHSANGTRLGQLEEMQGSIVRRKMLTELIRPATVYEAETSTTTQRQENGINVNEVIMLRWMYELTRNSVEPTLMTDNEGCAGFYKIT